MSDLLIRSSGIIIPSDQKDLIVQPELGGRQLGELTWTIPGGSQGGGVVCQTVPGGIAIPYDAEFLGATIHVGDLLNEPLAPWIALDTYANSNPEESVRISSIGWAYRTFDECKVYPIHGRAIIRAGQKRWIGIRAESGAAGSGGTAISATVRVRPLKDS